jgi:site-specific recombinase XerD
MEDLYNTQQRLNYITSKIRSSSISDSNKKQVLEFTTHCLADSVGKNKMSRYLYDLLNISLWLDKDFEEVTKQDIERILVKLQETKYSEWTKRGYKIILKKFYKWLRKTKSYPDEVEWIKTAIKENHKKLPEEILVEEEIKKLLDACTNIRDKALLATIYDSGCRVGELLNLRIKDVEAVDYGMKVCLAGKTGMRKVLLISAVPYLTEWLNEHPNKKPEAYLWVKRDGKRISYGRTRSLLADIAKAAHIQKKVNPHNFRHSRATFYASKLREREMMEYFGWRKSDTVGIYVHLNGETVDRAILRSNGIIKEQEQDGTILKPRKCERCGNVNKATDTFCSKCSLALDEKTMQELKQKDIERQQADEIMNKLVKDPEVWELIKKKLEK